MDFNSLSKVPIDQVYCGDETLKPWLSIVIPTFRRPELLRHAVMSALNQSPVPFSFEIVIVDNSQEDAYVEKVNAIVQELNHPSLVLYRNTQNVGMFGNWNRCFQVARGEWVTILNDDDFFLPACVDEFFRVKNEQPEASLIQVAYTVFDQRMFDKFKFRPKNVSGKVTEISLSRLFYGNDRAGSLGIFYRKDLAFSSGGFDEKNYPAADFYLNVKYLFEHGVGYESSRQVCVYRIFENESMRPDVLLGFVEKEYQLRLWLASLYGIKLAKFYANLAVMAHVSSLERAWKTNMNKSFLGKSKVLSGISLKINPLVSRVLSKFFRLFFSKLISLKT